MNAAAHRQSGNLTGGINRLAKACWKKSAHKEYCQVRSHQGVNIGWTGSSWRAAGPDLPRCISPKVKLQVMAGISERCLHLICVSPLQYLANGLHGCFAWSCYSPEVRGADLPQRELIKDARSGHRSWNWQGPVVMTGDPAWRWFTANPTKTGCLGLTRSGWQGQERSNEVEHRWRLQPTYLHICFGELRIYAKTNSFATRFIIPMK